MSFLSDRFSIASKENLGNYSCLFENEAKVDFILAGTHSLLFVPRLIAMWFKFNVIIFNHSVFLFTILHL